MPSALFVAQRVDGAGRLVEGTLQSMLRRFATDRNLGRSLETKRDEGLAKGGGKILRRVIGVPTFGSSHKCVHDSAPAGRPRRGKRVRMRSCQLTSGAVVCRSVDGRLRGPRF